MPGVDALNGRCSIGVDIVDVDRLRRMVQRSGDHMLDRLLGPAERDVVCGARGVRWDSLAGRVAAKEAVRKVFGSSGSMPRWQDIEVETGPHGEPVLLLRGAARTLADSLGFQRLLLSIAHEKSAAVAVVLAM